MAGWMDRWMGQEWLGGLAGWLDDWFGRVVVVGSRCVGALGHQPLDGAVLEALHRPAKAAVVAAAHVLPFDEHLRDRGLAHRGAKVAAQSAGDVVDVDDLRPVPGVLEGSERAPAEPAPRRGEDDDVFPIDHGCDTGHVSGAGWCGGVVVEKGAWQRGEGVGD